jgi:hypothetical protein
MESKTSTTYLSVWNLDYLTLACGCALCTAVDPGRVVQPKVPWGFRFQVFQTSRLNGAHVGKEPINTVAYLDRTDSRQGINFPTYMNLRSCMTSFVNHPEI